MEGAPEQVEGAGLQVPGVGGCTFPRGSWGRVGIHEGVHLSARMEPAYGLGFAL